MFIEGEPPRPVPLAGRFKPVVSAPPLRDVAAILSFKRPAFTLPPKLALRLRSSLVPAPAGALRAFMVADVDTAAAAGSGETPEPGLCGRERGKRRSRMAQDGRSGRGPCPDTWGKMLWGEARDTGQACAYCPLACWRMNGSRTAAIFCCWLRGSREAASKSCRIFPAGPLPRFLEALSPSSSSTLTLRAAANC